MLPIEYFPQVKEFIIGYVRGLKNERYPEYSRYCENISDCKFEINQTTNFTHYKYPNGDSKFEFNATFDVWNADNISAGVQSFKCKNFEIVLHNLCGNCPNNPIQFQNKNKIKCDRYKKIKPWQHGR